MEDVLAETIGAATERPLKNLILEPPMLELYAIQYQ
jgi:hypothetical protein